MVQSWVEVSHVGPGEARLPGGVRGWPRFRTPPVTEALRAGIGDWGSPLRNDEQLRPDNLHGLVGGVADLDHAFTFTNGGHGDGEGG